jgi:tetratricopeptide (TPR) repeat protein
MAAEPEPLPEFDSKWNYDQPESTEAAFRALLPAARASGDHDYLARLLTQIARAQGLQMKFDDAARTLDEAESLLTGEMKVARVRLLLERGRMLNSSKRREESVPLFQAAWDLAREARADGFAVDAAHMLGIVEPGERSVEWNRTAVAYAEASPDPKARAWLGSLYNNLGWTYHDRGEYATALDLFRRALAAREAEGSKPRIRIANWCIARTLRSLGRTEEALAMQERLLAELTAEGGVDGYVHEEMAECLLALGREAEARPHFAAAYRSLSQDEWLKRDEPDRLDRLRRLGDLDGTEVPGTK